MTSGDKSAQSYGWSTTLTEPTPDGGNVKVPTPGLDIRYTDTEHAQVTVSTTGVVYEHDDDRVTTSFDETEGSASCTVVNNTGDAWPQGASLYVFCPHLLAEGDNTWDLKGQIYDLHQEVDALETRVTALEGGSEASKSPKTPPKPVVEPPKASSPPHKANVPPSKPPNSPQRAPAPPPGGQTRR